jgi:L,D-transpeptidase ErfK/SrfK
MVRHTLIFLTVMTFSSLSSAANYILNNDEDTLLGGITTVVSSYEDTLLDIARENGLGYSEIKLLNPELDTWLPGEGAVVNLPTHFILPQAAKEGIVLNIPEMRLYSYSKLNADGTREVTTYPIGIGKEGWDTPYAKTRIIEKKKNPSWRPPKSIREEHEAKGDPLPLVVEAGPDNPLGHRAMRLGLPSYLIHGTNKPAGVGMRVSHGCIRLYPEDIESLFNQINLGTRVHIVNQPYKVGALKDDIYLEAHPYLEEDAEIFQSNLTSVVRMIVNITNERDYEIDWDLAQQVVDNGNGVPVKIGRFIETEQQATSIDLNNELPEDNKGDSLDLRLDNDLSAL